MLLKSFISLAIIITIATGWARANLYTADNKLAVSSYFIRVAQAPH